MTDLVKERLDVLLESPQLHLKEFKEYESQPTKDPKQRAQKMMEVQELIEGKKAMMKDENNKLPSMISESKDERSKEETEAYKIWKEETKFL